MSFKNAIYPSSMNFTTVILAFFLIIYVEFTKCQRLTHTEMKVVLNSNKRITNEIVSTAENRKCLQALNGSYHPQVPYSFAVCDTSPIYMVSLHIYSFNNFTYEGKCENVDCWESQLTEATRFDIVDIFNTYRQSVARGSCGRRCKTNKKKLIFELRWLLAFEMDAQRFMNSCVITADHTKLTSFYPENVTHSYGVGDFVATSFKVETGLQSELRTKLWDLLNGNHLYDWEAKTEQFRRGLTNEVGCAYIVRRNVFMTTALGEEVNSGDVAHFGCFFGYLNQNAMNEWSLKELSTTAANCRSAGGDSHPSTLTLDALYPSLCIVIQDLTKFNSPTMTCRPDHSYTAQHISSAICNGTGSVQNTQTWSEKVSGLLFRFTFIQVPYNVSYNATHNVTRYKDYHVFYDAECTLPDLPKYSPPFDSSPGTETSSPCTSDYEVNVTTTTTVCPGWSYNDSQLVNETRQHILNSLNEAREIVAQGKCKDICRPPCNCKKKTEYCNVVKLRWHWHLESLAAEKVQNCSTEYAINKANYPNSPFLESSFFEEVGVVFDLPPEGQTKLPDKVMELFWTNGLNDWGNDGTFRRGSAAWIGCAIIVRPGQQIGNMRAEYRMENGTATHMVCVYVSPDEDFISKQGLATKPCCPSCTQGSIYTVSNRCLLRTAKGVPPFPLLCSPFLLSEEITLNCPVGTRSRLGAEQQQKEKEKEKYLRKIYSRKVCKIVIFLYLVALSVLLLVLALLYKYSVEKKLYSKS